MAIKENEVIFLSQVERFGYTLMAVGRTQKEAENALIRAYIDEYKKINGVSPGKEKTRFGDTYLAHVKEDIYTTSMQIGDVIWV